MGHGRVVVRLAEAELLAKPLDRLLQISGR
jgi:hypothetical protein